MPAPSSLLTTAHNKATGRYQTIQESIDHRRLRRAACQGSFIEYIREVAPWFQIEEIHLVIAEFLERLMRKEFDRGMIFMAPRTGKSMMASVFAPSYFFGLNPTRKILQVSYQTDLAEDFGREVRSLVRSEAYNDIFPGVVLTKDSRAVGHWQIETPEDQESGEYRAAGATAGIAGKGYHFGIMDDPMSEQDARSKVAKDRLWDWYGSGFYTRRQPEFNIILLMMTRWAKDDIAGHLEIQMRDDSRSDQWEVLNVPAILDAASAKRMRTVIRGIDALPDGGAVIKPAEGKSFQPRRFPIEELLRSKHNMRSRDWSALYLGNPVADEGHILKRKYWRRWQDKKKAPACHYVVQTYDTAFEDHEDADFSARTTWGIFKHSDTGLDKDERYNVILLERWKERVAASDLRKIAWDSAKRHEPDRILIEKRASGIQLIQELRRAGVPVKGWLPPGGSRHNKGKVPRAHAASIVLELGAVWYMDRDWANDVIDECADFPFGENDDLVDTCTIAWTWLRQTFWLELGDEGIDDEDDEPLPQKAKRVLYG